MWTRVQRFVVIAASIIPSFGYALHWPAFDKPSENFLLAHGYIQTAGCPAGKGRLIGGEINVRQMLCRSYCPETWNWVGEKADECRELGKEFEFLKFRIEHVWKDNGATDYSIVDAVYGDKSTGREWFKFSLRTEKGRGWYCVEAEDGVSCANDM